MKFATTYGPVSKHDYLVKQAYAKSKGELYRDLCMVYPPVSQWSKEELVSAWIQQEMAVPS